MTRPEISPVRKATVLGTITNQQQRIHDIRWQIRADVRMAVSEGVTWREVGEALGVSAQSAWSTYRPKEPAKIKPGI